ncbi:HEPN domain-containing protein [Variovorax sp. KK3]|uniref:HEPN domain-containing protein n=1 Tax=Variovorax sp. KK3 TaxID=1855728 RepID=UPI00097CBE32|nr:HEPN domain-containing protein [Variovorax sp. KK3]
MSIPTLDALLNTPGTPLERISTVNKSAVQGWLTEAGRKLEDARRSANSTSTRMDAAYDAVFFCALGVLAARGVRVTSRAGHHDAGLEAAAAVMNLSIRLQDQAEALKDWRNRKYQGAFTAKERDVEDALATAREYMEATSAWLQQSKPDLLK